MTKFDTIMKGDEDAALNRQTRFAAVDWAPCQVKAAAACRNRMRGVAQNADAIMNKEQLYDVFQQILHIKKFEHQIIFNALQLENCDEQAAAIRREVATREETLREIPKLRKLMPKFVVKDMETLFLDEASGIKIFVRVQTFQLRDCTRDRLLPPACKRNRVSLQVRQSINQLIANLESVPVTPRGQTLSRKKDGKSRSRYANFRHHLGQEFFELILSSIISSSYFQARRSLNKHTKHKHANLHANACVKSTFWLKVLFLFGFFSLFSFLHAMR